jgi:hypothetical protein
MDAVVVANLHGTMPPPLMIMMMDCSVVVKEVAVEMICDPIYP